MSYLLPVIHVLIGWRSYIRFAYNRFLGLCMYLKVMSTQFLEPHRGNNAHVIEELVECAVDRAFDNVRYMSYVF